MFSNTMAGKICTGTWVQKFQCGLHGGHAAPGGGWINSQSGFNSGMLLFAVVGIVMLVISRRVRAKR